MSAPLHPTCAACAAFQAPCPDHEPPPMDLDPGDGAPDSERTARADHALDLERDEPPILGSDLRGIRFRP